MKDLIISLYLISILLFVKNVNSEKIVKEISDEFKIDKNTAPIFTEYEIIAPFDMLIDIDCRFEPPQECDNNSITIGVEGHSRDMVPYCDGNFTETSAFRRITFRSTLRDDFTCEFKVIKQTREICGASIARKIVDGVRASPNEFPYYAALYSIELQAVNCGGSLINHNTVLTAAHCFETDEESIIADTFVYIGLQSFENVEDNPYVQIVKPKKILNHKKFSLVPNLGDDISLVFLERPVEWSFGVGPVCLPNAETPDHFGTSTLIVLGFGQLKMRGDSSNVLMKASVFGLTDKNCTKQYNTKVQMNPNINKYKFCVVSPSHNNMDTCPGDSGGPVILKSNRDYLVGIVSAGLDCGKKIPSVNTKVKMYLKWIDKQVKEFANK